MLSRRSRVTNDQLALDSLYYKVPVQLSCIEEDIHCPYIVVHTLGIFFWIYVV